MIKHIYLYKIKDPSKKEEVVAKLMSLKNHVPEIFELEVGMDFKGADNSYEICEYVTFRTMQDFLAFGKNEYHESIRQYMSSVQKSSVKIDYEC